MNKLYAKIASGFCYIQCKTIDEKKILAVMVNNSTINIKMNNYPPPKAQTLNTKRSGHANGNPVLAWDIQMSIQLKPPSPLPS